MPKRGQAGGAGPLWTWRPWLTWRQPRRRRRAAGPAWAGARARATAPAWPSGSPCLPRCPSRRGRHVCPPVSAPRTTSTISTISTAPYRSPSTGCLFWPEGATVSRAPRTKPVCCATWHSAASSSKTGRASFLPVYHRNRVWAQRQKSLVVLIWRWRRRRGFSNLQGDNPSLGWWQLWAPLAPLSARQHPGWLSSLVAFSVDAAVGLCVCVCACVRRQLCWL